jgi:hypothetical protein
LLALVVPHDGWPRPATGRIKAEAPTPALRRPAAAVPTFQRSSALPLALRGAVSAMLAAQNTDYRLRRTAEGIRSVNPQQRLSADFRTDGVHIRSGGDAITLAVRAIGTGETLRPVPQTAPRIVHGRVLYATPMVQTWYSNEPRGIEQGFTVARPVSPHTTGLLTLAVSLGGDVRASLARDEQSVALSGADDSVLRYDGLAAMDAHGRALRAWLRLSGDQMLIRVDAKSGAFPVRIDPFVQQGGELQAGHEAVGSSAFGFSAALSSDGNTALVGAPGDNGGVGAVWVFTRSGSTWTQHGPKLTGSEEAGAGGFGESVALSEDGETALIGGPSNKARVGAAWVFTRSGSTWSQQGKKLTGKAEAGKGEFGGSVALSGDGNTAVIGGPGDDARAGAVWAFARTGSTWNQQGSKLTATGEQGTGSFGFSAAVSANGNTAVLGAPTNAGCVGAAWAFTREGTKWSQQAELVGGSSVSKCDDPDAATDFGESVALSGDGATALVGNPSAGPFNTPYAIALVRSGSTWTEQAGISGDASAVALSFDGNLALSSGFLSPEPVLPGGGSVSMRAGSTWSLQQEALSGNGAEFEEFGRSAALSANGESALLGAPGAAGGGGAWVFANRGPRVAQVTPSFGATAGGTSVTITGSNFTNVSAVIFGSTNAASFKVDSSTSITAVSPAGTGQVNVTVSNPEATSAIAELDTFTYVPPPTITSISPTHGPAAGGTDVRIRGKNTTSEDPLTGVSSVHFGTTSAAFTVNFEEDAIEAVAPAGTTGIVNVTVTTPGGTSAASSRAHFKYERPTITAVSPDSGPAAGATAVTIEGSGFAPGSAATSFEFGAAHATSVNCSSTTTCTASSPPHKANTVDVTAIVKGTSSKKTPPADQFTYH